jgi:hypothetical protein
MPRIPDAMLECIFYLYPSHAAAENGEQSGGCGFFMTVPFERAKRNHLYAITNRHVIDGGACTLRINTDDGRCFPADSEERRWFHHPKGDDLSILLIDSPSFPIQFTTKVIEYRINSFVTRQQIQELDIGPGDDVFTVGRFVSHEGKQQNTPVVRFGNIAQMPIEPIRQDTGHLQDSYLVEGRSVGGYSGSPVFAFIPPFAVRPKADNVSSRYYGPMLLGVNWGHLNDWKPVCDASGRPSSTQKVPQNSGMMGVVPVWKLIEMMEDERMIKQRREEEDRVLGKGLPISSTDRAAEPAPATTEENPEHKEAFKSLLGAAAKKKKRDD